MIATANGNGHTTKTDVGGYWLNSVLLKHGAKSDLPPIVFLHGASTSLYDPMFSFRKKLEGRATLLFVDRPGHGDSQAGGPQNILPDGQADAIVELMRLRGVSKAIIVGHSYGGSVAAALAVRHPDMVIGVVFLSPALYPWEGGVAWYYRLASRPVLGLLFSSLIAPPVGLLALDNAAGSVFAPNPKPADYLTETRALQALRPSNFRHNAREISALSGWASKAKKQFKKISAPTVIITGDADGIVSPTIHSKALAKSIANSKLIVVHGLGHKSDFVGSDLAIAAIESIAGKKVNLDLEASKLERTIAEQ